MSKRHETASGALLKRHVDIPEHPSVPQQQRFRRHWLGWAAVLLSFVGTTFWISSRGEVQEVRTGRFVGGAPMPVIPAVAQKADIAVTLNALGTVTPLATVLVRTQIDGRLIEVGFREGEMVNEGDFLAQIDPRAYQAALSQAEGQLQRNMALLKNAELDFERYRALSAQNTIAQKQLDAQEYLVRQYQGIVKSDQALVDSARLNLAYCRIVAPITGRLGLRHVDQGNYIRVSDTNGIGVITQVKPITVMFSIPEDDVPAVLRQIRAAAQLPVSVFDRSHSKLLAQGVVSAIDNEIDTATGNVRLRAQFDNDDETLFPNQFVTVDLLVEELRDRTVVPMAAIQRGAPGMYVYLVNPDNTVSVRPVKLGVVDGDRVEVLAGLAPGDKTVQDGADRLKDGAKVSLPTATARGGVP